MVCGVFSFGMRTAANRHLAGAAETTVPIAAKNVNDELVLTDDVLAQLASAGLGNVSLFEFADSLESARTDKRSLFPKCKVFPGDLLWPVQSVWKLFNLLTGDALIKTVPIGAVCYTNNEHYDADKCQEILAHWNESPTQ